MPLAVLAAGVVSIIVAKSLAPGVLDDLVYPGAAVTRQIDRDPFAFQHYSSTQSLKQVATHVGDALKAGSMAAVGLGMFSRARFGASRHTAISSLDSDAFEGRVLVQHREGELLVVLMSRGTNEPSTHVFTAQVKSLPKPAEPNTSARARKQLENWMPKEYTASSGSTRSLAAASFSPKGRWEALYSGWASRMNLPDTNPPAAAGTVILKANGRVIISEATSGAAVRSTLFIQQTPTNVVVTASLFHPVYKITKAAIVVFE